MRWTWLWLVVSVAGCAAPEPPRFASWDPVRSDIPRPGNRAQASARLRASHALWQKWRSSTPPTIMETGRAPVPEMANEYSYVRARQTAATEVSFTLFVVQGERVVLRALMTADPSQLSRAQRQPGRLRIISRWVERNAQVGSHDDGAPAKTVDQLYADCERLIERGKAPPRLFFDPEGLLMQCGYPPQECSDCETASVTSLSRFSVRREVPRRDPAAWLCEAETGPVAPGTALPLLPSDYACLAPTLPSPSPSPPPVAPSAGQQDICIIDPSACPKRSTEIAEWGQMRPPICPEGPERGALPLEVGKSDPLAAWSFPFFRSAGIECGPGGTYLRHIRPRAP